MLSDRFTAAFFDGGVHMAANLSLIAVLWYGGGLVASQAMSAGDLTAFLLYSVYTGFNISGLVCVCSVSFPSWNFQ